MFQKIALLSIELTFQKISEIMILRFLGYSEITTIRFLNVSVVALVCIEIGLEDIQGIGFVEVI